MSHTRLCASCAERRFNDNLHSLVTMNGPFAKHWRTRIAASVGAVIPERLDTTPERR
jgi:hypothetical protein